MSKIAKIACAVALAGVIITPVQSATPEEKAVKSRQGYMQISALNIGILAAMVKGKVEYNAAEAQIAADNLKLVSQIDMSSMWLEGTSNKDKKMKTKALPEIWDADSKIVEKASDYAKASSDVAAVAGQGLEPLKSKFAALGKSCKGCHKSYREAKKKK